MSDSGHWKKGAIGALVGLFWLVAPGAAQAQGQGEGAAASKGENFSAKPAAQLFASDCTGAGCHKGPQGLVKNGGVGLAGFLREHYTNSRESAAALASYLSKLPSGPEPKEPKEKEGRNQRTAKPAPASNTPGWGAGFSFSSGEPGALTRPEPKESHPPKHPPSTRTTRAPSRPEETTPENSSTSAAHEPAPGESRAKAGANAQAAHVREPEPATPPPAEAAPSPPPAPAATAQAPSAPPGAKKQYDIFD